jgi:hypothetical protein
VTKHLKPGHLIKIGKNVHLVVQVEYCQIELDEEGQQWLFDGTKSRLVLLTEEQVNSIKNKNGGKLVYAPHNLVREEE